MAALPSYVKMGWRDMREARDPVVERSQMERGIPKQRRITSDVRREVEVTLHFDTKANLASFETWFDTTIRSGQDFFDFVQPRTGATVQGRFMGGEIGPVSFINPTLEKSMRQAKIEYWTASWA